MLTKELILSNEALKSLNEEQIAAITGLSKNDEEIVIGKKIKELHDHYDADIKSITGLEKPANVKTYDHLKTVLSDLQKNQGNTEELTKLKDQITALTKEKTDLEKKIADGSQDEALKGKIKDLEKLISDKDGMINQMKTSKENDVKDLQSKLEQQTNRNKELEVFGSIDQYQVSNNIVFNKSIDQKLIQETLQNRKNSFIQTIQTDRVNEGGKERLVIRDEKGEIIRDKTTLEPLTPGQHFANLHLQDLIEVGKKQPGGGTSGGGGGGNTPTNLSLNGVTNRVEADEKIDDHLMKVEGLSKMDKKFYDRRQELRAEFNVDALPTTANEQ